MAKNPQLSASCRQLSASIKEDGIQNENLKKPITKARKLESTKNGNGV
jgi:hypothetical protein